jgi:hypothetical protein
VSDVVQPTPPMPELPDSDTIDALAIDTASEVLAAKIERVDKFVRTFDVRIDNTTLNLDAAAQVTYDPNMLTKAFVDQPAKMAWFGALGAKLQRVVSGLKLNITKAKMRVEEVRALVAGEVRAGIIPVPGNKVTVDSVKEAVELDSRVRNAEAEAIRCEEIVLDAQETLDHVRAVLEALRHRREVIVADGYLQAAEMRSSQLTVK